MLLSVYGVSRFHRVCDTITEVELSLNITHTRARSHTQTHMTAIQCLDVLS